MTIKEQLQQIKDYLDAAPFTRREMEMAWAYFDDNLFFAPHNIFALSVALEYARKKGKKRCKMNYTRNIKNF